MPGTAADAVTDPLGAVLELVTAAEPVLDRAVIAGVVSSVAPGRNVRRRLARALAERPALLTDGRSPAPRVAGSLLIALRQAGAVSISLPVCAGCGKQLRSLQRRGRDWYCGACGPPLLRCAVCGNMRKIAARDRQGRPRCHSCLPDDDPDPMQILLDVLAALDPMLDAATVTGAVQAAAPRAGQRRQLAWALQDRPELLTGAGAQAPVPSVLRLIDALTAAGSGRITRPPCPRCGRVITLSKILGGTRVCRNCLAKSRAEACSRCGTHREPATRDEHGRPLCPHCLSTDPSNLETCLGCARRRPVSIRTPEGPLCPGCRPAKVMTCSICGRSAARGDLQGHRAALVHSMPAAMGTVRALRRGQADPRRDPHHAVLRGLHPPRGVVLALLPGLRAAAPDPLAFLRTVQPASTAERTARRHRRGPCRTAGPAREPGHQPAA